MKIAVASSSGKIVDLHLGHANSIYVYQWENDGISFLEHRKLAISKSDKHQGSEVLMACKDCDVIISKKYGFKTKLKAEDLDIKLVIEQDTPVDEAINNYIEHYKFMNN